MRNDYIKPLCDVVKVKLDDSVLEDIHIGRPSQYTDPDSGPAKENTEIFYWDELDDNGMDDYDIWGEQD